MEPKLTRPCTAKGTTSKVKRHPSDWEKTLANDAANKGSISKTHKQLMQPSLNSVRMGRRPRRTPLQSRRPEGYQAHEKTLSRASHQRNANPNLREALPHTSQNGHYQNVQIPDSGEIAEKRDTAAPYTHAASGECRLVQPLWKTKHRLLTIPHSIPLSPEASAEGDRAGWQSGWI